MLRILMFGIFLCQLATSNGQDVAEARGYADATVAMLSGKDPFDLIVVSEESIEADGIIAPSAKMTWRLRQKTSESKVSFAMKYKQLGFDRALSGRLNEWQSTSFVKQIIGGNVVELHLGGTRVQRKAKDFESAMTAERIPNISLLGQFKVPWSLTNPQDAKERLPRLYSLAKKVSVKQVTVDGEDAVDVRAIIEDKRLTETHRWLYMLATLDLVRYEISQRPPGNPAKTIFSQTLEWEDDKNYGRVPVGVRCTAKARFSLREEGGKNKVIYGEKHTDLTLNWRQFDPASEIQLGKALNIAEFEELFVE